MGEGERKEHGIGTVVLSLLLGVIAVAVLYVLSAVPVSLLCAMAGRGDERFLAIYGPVVWLYENSSVVQKILDCEAKLFGL